MRKPNPTTILVCTAIAVWLASCSLTSWAYTAYGHALQLNPIYWWVYGGLILLFGVLAEQQYKQSSKTPRWYAALLLVLFTLLAYILVQEPDFNSLLYWPTIWVLLLMALFGIAVWIYPHLPFRRPMRPKRTHSQAWNCAIGMLVL